MKTDWTALEPHRLRQGVYASNTGDTFGFFVFQRGIAQVRAMAADGSESGWEHVSVSVLITSAGKPYTALPDYAEMCRIKELFWDDEECVVQFHPPKSQHVNNHAKCLHLWKCVNAEQPMPPSILVGIKELGTITR